ncbi:unnamed protein product [Alopecurus aequalis]
MASTSTHDVWEEKLQDPNGAPVSLPLEFLKAITCDFSTELVLGQGGYGVVYKGVLQSGKTIAVKKLFELRLKDETFQNEVKYLMKIKHQHIVQLVGYCAESRWEAIEQPSGSGNHIFAEIPNRLLCFEYVCNEGLDKYISVSTDESPGLEWNMRYKIIKGICTGLHFLHEDCRIVHLDLKPENILMDAAMTPKIADFGLSRIFGEQQSRIITDNRAGTRGYMAPEYLMRGVVSRKADIFSFGVMIIEMMTGCKDYPLLQQDNPQSADNSFRHFEEKVLRSWRKWFFSEPPKFTSAEKYMLQVETCITIALKCVDRSMEKRPTANDILQMLSVTEEFLEIYPLELRFPFESNKLITCSMDLTNTTDENVVFMLTEKKRDYCTCFLGLPLYGVVPPRSTYTLVVTADKRKNRPKSRDADLILQSSLGAKYIKPFRRANDCEKYLEEATKLRNVVHILPLKAVYATEGDSTCELANPPLIKIISVEKTHVELYALDANRIEPWIITGHEDGCVAIWDYNTQKSMRLIKISENTVCSLKFIERKQWFLVGSMDGLISVYKYNCNKKAQGITSFIAHTESYSIRSLAVHATQPYVLSSCQTHIQLWDWTRSWECRRTFEESDTVNQVAFNPKDTNSFASASDDHRVKVWSIDSCQPKYTLSGHLGGVNCLDFFTHDNQQYLITGSDDKTAKIWDLQKRKCVHTLEAFMYPVISTIYNPCLQVLITGTRDGAIHLWNSTTFRLERILNIGCHRRVCGLAALMESRRVVVGHDSAVSMLEIRKEGRYANKGKMKVQCEGKE